MNTSNVSPLPEGSDAHRVTIMDRRIERNWLRRNWKPFAAAMLMASIGTAVAMWPEHGRTFVVDDTRINISTVTTGQFDDFIPVRGRVTPLRTIFLDAVEGGRVEKIHIVRLLLMQFSKPVIMAIFIASPLTYVTAGQYLNFFAERAGLPFGLFFGAGFGILLLAWLTVVTHAIRVAQSSPILALRYE